MVRPSDSSRFSPLWGKHELNSYRGARKSRNSLDQTIYYISGMFRPLNCVVNNEIATRNNNSTAQPTFSAGPKYLLHAFYLSSPQEKKENANGRRNRGKGINIGQWQAGQGGQMAKPSIFANI
jgi:hypothetical protein